MKRVIHEQSRNELINIGRRGKVGCVADADTLAVRGDTETCIVVRQCRTPADRPSTYSRTDIRTVTRSSHHTRRRTDNDRPYTHDRVISPPPERLHTVNSY